MSKKIDFEKLEKDAKKEVQKKEIISDEKLDAALKTIHESKTEAEKEESKNKKTETEKPSEIDTEIEKDAFNNKPTKVKNWTKRNCINVPRDLYMRLKTRSLDEQMPMYQYILHCVEQYLDLTEAPQNHELEK